VSEQVLIKWQYCVHSLTVLQLANRSVAHRSLFCTTFFDTSISSVKSKSENFKVSLDTVFLDFIYQILFVFNIIIPSSMSSIISVTSLEFVLNLSFSLIFVIVLIVFGSIYHIRV